jgi:hypothetical protein
VSSLFLDGEIDADLQRLAELWPKLSPEIRQAILRIAEH